MKKLPIIPHLCVLLVGEDKASEIYVNNKRKACEKYGIKFTLLRLSAGASLQQVLKAIELWNRDDDVSGIIVQLPLPATLPKLTVLNAVSPSKDVDGFHFVNLGKSVQNDTCFVPCTPLAVLEMLKYYNVPIIGKHICLVNDSIVIGRPLATLLGNQGATITICNKKTEQIRQICSSADIIVVAVGKKPDFVLDKSFCKPGVVIIDVGINKIDGVISGDVDESVMGVAGMVSRVPGGVGLVTVSMLLKNVVLAAQKRG